MACKCAVLLLCLLGAAVALQIKKMECPFPDSYESVYYPDLNDCTRFYQCSNGQPIHLNCAPGTVFNATLNVCDHPTDPSCIPTTRVKTMDCPFPDNYESVYHPDLDDCTRFYQCSNGQPIHLNCAPGTVFNATLNVCVHPTDSSCIPTSRVKKMECPFPDNYESVYYPDLNDCTRFYQCSNGQPIHLNCAPGTVFNATLNVCDHPTDPSCIPTILS